MPPTRTRPPQLLIASHNHGAGAELLQLAERRGYAVRRAHSGAQALEQAHAGPPDLVVLDESLTDMDAVAATRALRSDADLGPRTPLQRTNDNPTNATTSNARAAPNAAEPPLVERRSVPAALLFCAAAARGAARFPAAPPVRRDAGARAGARRPTRSRRPRRAAPRNARVAANASMSVSDSSSTTR